MYVSKKYKFVYFGPTKAASNTISYIIVNFFDAFGVKPSDMEQISGDDGWPPAAHHSAFLPEKYADYFTFTTVRNPYIRELSKYNFLVEQSQYQSVYKAIGQMSFENYMQWVCEEGPTGFWRHDMWKRTLKELIFNQPVRKNCVPVRLDCFIKCENIIENFFNLPFVSPNKEILRILEGRINFATEHNQKQFPVEQSELCYNHFKEDFDMFNYKKEIPEYKPVESSYKMFKNEHGRTVTTNLFPKPKKFML
ncbi:MAG: hypothetical protein DWQ19_09790 [Crenarchaeota archaeon]|nr:MAG: hypothetical protein DWQ19_09790 [Thermoproteota archaeon]